MTNEQQIRRGVSSAVAVLTAWLESDDPAADASFAEQQVRQIASRGPSAGGDFVIGLIVLAGTLLDDVAACTGRDRSDLLQQLALRFLPE